MARFRKPPACVCGGVPGSEGPACFSIVLITSFRMEAAAWPKFLKAAFSVASFRRLLWSSYLNDRLNMIRRSW